MVNFHIAGDFKNNAINYIEHPKIKNAKDTLLTALVSSLLRVQGRKYTYKTENEKNDALADSLRDKGYSVLDQTRLGRSGTDKTKNYNSGELDIVITDPEKNSEIISIIEALELSTVGEKNKLIKSHIDKLIYRYDTAGNHENFIIIYAKAKHFDKLWKKYKQNINSKIFLDRPDIRELEMSKSEIKCGRTTYIRSGKQLILHHLFVNMHTG